MARMVGTGGAIFSGVEPVLVTPKIVMLPVMVTVNGKFVACGACVLASPADRPLDFMVAAVVLEELQAHVSVTSRVVTLSLNVAVARNWCVYPLEIPLGIAGCAATLSEVSVTPAGTTVIQAVFRNGPLTAVISVVPVP